MSSNRRIRRLPAACWMFALFAFHAVAEGATGSIDIEKQPLPGALREFSEQTGLQVAYIATLAKDKTSRGTQGRTKPEEALVDILDGTELQYQYVNDVTVAIASPTTPAKESSAASGGRMAPEPLLLAHLQQPARQTESSQQGPAEDSDSADAEEGDEALELQEVVVTGSRLGRAPTEISKNVIVLTREDIRASGELTLARVLQQLPQNINATNETFLSQFNYGANVTGAAAVNLRGLGSESTLILVDGLRVGYSGILGGVTDISNIPLSMVERIEILLDGGSAIYGSDAVGGVVNIITRKDYEGVEIDLNHGRPHQSGYDETRASIGKSWAWSGGRANAAYEYFRHSGLDASQRDSIVNGIRQLGSTWAPLAVRGPQTRVFHFFHHIFCLPFNAILYELDGQLLQPSEYNALDADSKARANCLNDFTLPNGFQYTDDIQSIDLFGDPQWGEESELGVHLLPEQSQDVIRLGLEQELSDSITLRANLRIGRKDTNAARGHNSIIATLHRGNPYNPFEVEVQLSGLSVDTPPLYFDSRSDDLFVNVGIEGSLGSWTWQTQFGRSTQDLDTTRFNVLDTAYADAINSDGVSEARIRRESGVDEAACEALRAELGGTRYVYSSLFGGRCDVYGAPPDPINPFESLQAYVIPGADSGTRNEQTRAEVVVRGEVFEMPGGAVALVAGYDYRNDTLDSFYNFTAGAFLSGPAPTSGHPFNTKVSRDLHAFFVEGLIPVVGHTNEMAGVQRLNLTFSGRLDSYSEQDVEYRPTPWTDESGALTTESAGEDTTWSAGFLYQPAGGVRLRGDFSTSFRSPQLNQLLARVEFNSAASFVHYVEGDSGPLVRLRENVIGVNGGNPELESETADTISLTADFSPSFLPGLHFKVGWSDTDYEQRILKQRLGPVDLNNLPTNVKYVEEEGIYYIENRFINVYAIRRSSIDLRLQYDLEQGLNSYRVTLRRSYNTRYDVQQDEAFELYHDIVTTRDDTGTVRTPLPPVPHYQTSAQFIWTRGGLFLSLDVQGADTTQIRITDDIFRITEPATSYDVVLGYDFGGDSLFDTPAWMDGLGVTLTINNLTNDFARNSEVNVSSGAVDERVLNPFYEWTQGRSYRLRIHKSF